MTQLTQKRLREVLEYAPETGGFTWIVSSRKGCVGKEAGRLDNKGYWRIGIDKKEYAAHRLAWLYVHGVWPENDIDHINRVRTDNRLCNLRDVSRSDNLHNTVEGTRNRSGVKGVHWCNKSKRYIAKIMREGRSKFFGQYSSIDDAIRASRLARIEDRP